MKITLAEKIYDCTGLEPTNTSLDCRLLVLFDRQGKSANELETDLYFYHTDHPIAIGMGSSSWITDATGSAYQHIQSLPFGEQFIEQRQSSWDAMYKFTGKERDMETGFDYFGARYYDSELSIWLSVDPLADKYPSMSAYMYTAGNPVMLVDPDGRAAGKPQVWVKNVEGSRNIYDYATNHLKYSRLNNYYDVFAHGNHKLMIGSDGKKIRTPEQFISEMKKNDDKFKKSFENGELIIIHLHSCNTGADEDDHGNIIDDSFAQRLSETYDNIIVIAPDGKVVTQPDNPETPESNDAYEEGIYDKDGIGSYNWFYKGEIIAKDTSVSLPPNNDAQTNNNSINETKNDEK